MTDKPKKVNPFNPFELPSAMIALWSFSWRLGTRVFGRKLILAGTIISGVGIALYILITGG